MVTATVRFRGSIQTAPSGVNCDGQHAFNSSHQGFEVLTRLIMKTLGFKGPIPARPHAEEVSAHALAEAMTVVVTVEAEGSVTVVVTVTT